MSYQIFEGDCLSIMPTIEAGSVDAIISDPPYPEISRPYGRMTESDWADMMQQVVKESRRVLKPTGSAVFILQPNSKHVGTMRPWLWKFMAWCCEEWNIVQDAYWWNIAAQPTMHTQRQIGLMRGSLKFCVWVGNSDCYRAQARVLWTESEGNTAHRLTARAGRNYTPSGHSQDVKKMTNAALERGGVTPFNVLPIANAGGASSAGVFGHGAGTPQALSDWWTRYICPPGGVTLDPFMGSGTMGLSALKYSCKFVGIERDASYFNIAKKRIENAQPALLEVA